MNDYQKEAADLRQALETAAHEIAAALQRTGRNVAYAQEYTRIAENARAIVDLDYEPPHLTIANQLTGILIREHGPDRWKISYRVPSARDVTTEAYYRYDESRHGKPITVSRDRDPDAIAADINRRLWPYLEIRRADYAAEVKAELSEKANRQATKARLMKLPGTHAPSHRDNAVYGPQWTAETRYNGGVSRLIVDFPSQISREESIKITEQLARAAAEAIARAPKEQTR